MPKKGALSKKDAESLFNSVVHQWRRLPENRAISDDALNSSDFYDWFRANYPHAVEFQSEMGPREDIDVWFDTVFRRLGSR